MGIKKTVWAAGLCLFTLHALGQSPVDGVHYPAGLNGLQAGIPTAPGIYLRDDNWIYNGTSDQASDRNTLEYVQAPQLTWLTGWKFIGARIGMDVMVPLVYKEVEYGNDGRLRNGLYPLSPLWRNGFGLGDIKLEPILLAWHWQQWDLMGAASVWVPTGHYSPGDPVNVGDNEWSPMLTLGSVWYPDQKKSWSLSILNHYEMNSSQTGLRFVGSSPNGAFEILEYKKIPCSTYTLECAAGKTIFDHTDLGVAGYYQQQFSDNSASYNPGKDSDVVGAGPEISVGIPKLNLSLSLRYAYEFIAHDSTRGNTIDLSAIWKF